MSELLGKRIGHFRVVDSIGKGGMGEVYVGYDETLDRKVALKTIRAENRLNAEAKARFIREARVLSKLAHPNICQIFDYIEGADADVIVLELVKGRSLASAMRGGLDRDHKLKIALQIALVLMAAHEQNIVHRDLKPDNVMITDEGDVKVLDFGLARMQVDENTLELEARTAEIGTANAMASSSSPSATNPVTTLGTIMGTLGYMSPEQAAGGTATPASDMYSLGLLLQELFTGHRPYEKGLSAHELLRRAQTGETLPVQGLDPDLTNLINRLKSFPSGSRPSAVDTVDRIRWIQEVPHRKRKRALVTAAVVVLAVFALTMTFQTVRATRAERAAQREAKVASSVTEFLVDLFNVSNPYEKKSGETITARELLDQGAAKVQTELKNQPDVQARLMTTMGRVYRKLGLFAKAQPPLEAAIALNEQHAGSSVDLADSLFNLASLYSDQGKYAEAEPLFKRSLAMREKSLGKDSPQVAEVLNNYATLFARQGKFADAEPLLKRSVEIREKAFGPDAAILADGLSNLATLYSIQGKSSEAEALNRRTLAICEKAYGADHPRVADTLNNISVDYFENGRYADAEPLAARSLAIYEKALGREHPHLADALNNLAELLQLQGKYAQAAPLYERSLAICEKAYGPNHQRVAYGLTYLGKVYLDQGRVSAAEPLLRKGLTIYERSVGLNHPDAGRALYNLACLEARKGRSREALDDLRRALPVSAGAPWLATIEKEPSLAPLNRDAEFQRIVAETKKTSGT